MVLLLLDMRSYWPSDDQLISVKSEFDSGVGGCRPLDGTLSARLPASPDGGDEDDLLGGRAVLGAV